MNDEVLVKEKILFEGIVSYKSKKFDTLLTLNAKHLILEKKKGFIKKKYVVVKDILLEDIKVIKDDVKIENKKDVVTITLKDENVIFECETVKEAKKIVSEIKNILVGPVKKEKFLTITKNTASLIGTAISSGAVEDVVTAVKDKNIKLAAKAVEKFVDKI